MTVEQWTVFLGWNTAVQIGLLAVSVLILVAARGWVARVHGALLGVDAEALPIEYFRFVAVWKLLILVFLLVPYLVMRCLV